MVQQVDVLVIGGGAIGTAAAHALQGAGRSVTVLDAGEIGAGCSAENAGLIVPSHVVPLSAPGVMAQGLRWMLNPRSPFYIRPRLDPALMGWIWRFRGACSAARMHASVPVLHRLLCESLDALKDLAADLDLDLVRAGMLMTYTGAKGEKDCAATALAAREVGMEVNDLDATALRQVEPHVHSAARGGVFFPQDAHLDPARLVARLRRHAEAAGAVFLPRTAVTGATRHGGRLTTVHTPAGDFAPREVVLAAGAWAPGILPGVRLPVQAGKGYSVTLPAVGRIPRIPQILAEAKVSVTPLGDRLRFGGTLELSGLDDRINRTRAETLLVQAADYLDGLSPEAVPTTTIWSGFRPCSPDGLPLIGRYPGLDNLIVACGHAMIGISLAPITGRLVRDLAQGKAEHPSLVALSPSRFL